MFCRLKRGAEPMRGYGRVILLSELQQGRADVPTRKKQPG